MAVISRINLKYLYSICKDKDFYSMKFGNKNLTPSSSCQHKLQDRFFCVFYNRFPLLTMIAS